MRNSLLFTSFLGTALLAAGLGASAAATADHPDRPFGHGPFARLFAAQRGRMMTLRAELNLSDQQRDAIKETIQSHKQELAAAVKPAIEAHRALRDAVLADKSDAAAIRKAADDLGKKVGDAAVVIAKVKSEAVSKANLTPEQKKKIEDFRSASDASVDEVFKEIGAAK